MPHCSRKNDLGNAQDIKVLVDRFYDKVQADPLLAPIFNAVAKVDWDHHLSVMYQFWEGILFGSGTFSGQPYPKHAVLPINSLHFACWLELFSQTVDELFAGPMADKAKLRAGFIAKTFQQRMGLIAAAG